MLQVPPTKPRRSGGLDYRCQLHLRAHYFDALTPVFLDVSPLILPIDAIIKAPGFAS